jgi:tetratricopeptide (TPR) repeat protein
MNIKVYYNRSVALGLLKAYVAVIEDLNTCIRLNPAHTQAIYSRAYWYELSGNYTEAAKDYEDVIRLDPKNYETYFGLANVCKNQNEHAKTCEVIGSAIDRGSQIAVDLKDVFCK